MLFFASYMRLVPVLCYILLKYRINLYICFTEFFRVFDMSGFGGSYRDEMNYFTRENQANYNFDGSGGQLGQDL